MIMSRIMRVSEKFYREVNKMKEDLKKNTPNLDLSDSQLTNIIADKINKKRKKTTLGEYLFG